MAKAGKKNSDPATLTVKEVDSGKLDNNKLEPLPDYFPNTVGHTTERAQELLAEHGPNCLVEKVTPKWMVFLQQLYQPMPCMIWAAIIIEAAIQNWIDMGVLLAIQFINATIGWYEITKAGDAVAALKASLKPLATVKRDGKWQNMDALNVVPGDLVLLAAGSAIPADCAINEGRLEVDQSALTGESLPVTMRKGDRPKMGSNATRGEIEATVIATGMDTFFGKTAAMLNSKNELGNLQTILLRLMVVLVVLSITLCAAAFGFLMGNGEEFKKALSFSVVVLVASIPIAIEIVTTATLAIGSRGLSEHGAIVTNLSAIEEMAGMNVLCSDKTGTLTLNKMVIQEDTPTYYPDQTQYTVLQAAALAAKWKEPPRDALDTLTLTAADLPSLDCYEQVDFMPFDPTVKRTEGTLKGPDGQIFKTTKGAPQVIAALLKDTPENQVTRDNVAAKVHELGTRGIRSLAVAKTLPGETEWHMLGILTFLDPPRPDTKDTIEKALKLGVDVKMITGDHGVIAKETLRMLGMGTNVQGTKGIPPLDENGNPPKDCGATLGDIILEADGFAEVFPEHKFVLVEAFRQQGFATGMTGDGVNDAPALKRADVGIAVAGATDAARAAADIVLTGEGLGVLVHAILMARQIFKRIQAFINYRIAATLQLLFFFFLEVLIFRPRHFTPNDEDTNGEWDVYFFQLPVILLMVITVLNDGTLISIGYDNAVANKRPDKWNLPLLWLVSAVLGGVACVSSLLMLWFCLSSNDPNSVAKSFGLPGMRYGQIVTMIYLKVSISDFLTLFSSRATSWFFTSKPGMLLFIGAVGSLTVSTMLACFLPAGEIDEVPIEGLARGDYKLWALWTWVYCIIWWFIQDIAKVLTYRIVFHFDIFNSVSGSAVNMRAANDVNDPQLPQARKSVAMVENKLFMRKIDEALKEINTAEVQRADKLTENDKQIFGQLKQELAAIRLDIADALKPASTVGIKALPARRASVNAMAKSTSGLNEARCSSVARRESVGQNATALDTETQDGLFEQPSLIEEVRQQLTQVSDHQVGAVVEAAIRTIEEAAVNVHDVVDTAHGQTS